MKESTIFKKEWNKRNKKNEGLVAKYKKKCIGCSKYFKVYTGDPFKCDDCKGTNKTKVTIEEETH